MAAENEMILVTLDDDSGRMGSLITIRISPIDPLWLKPPFHLKVSFDKKSKQLAYAVYIFKRCYIIARQRERESIIETERTGGTFEILSSRISADFFAVSGIFIW